MRDKPDYYEFDGMRLFLSETYIKVLATGKDHIPSQTHRGFLLALARKAPDVVTYKGLWKKVWRSNFEMSDTDLRNIQTTKGNLIGWLKSIGVKPHIYAEPGKGYRLNCEVVPGWLENKQDRLLHENLDSQSEPPDLEKSIDQSRINVNDEIIENRKIENWQQILTLHIAYVIPISVFYGTLFLIAVLMEVAYEFDVYGNTAISWGLLLMLINCLAFSAACGIISYRLLHKKNAFLVAATILFGAVLISILLSVQFLPFRPITQAAYQTQPAFIAFGKNALAYFLPLGIIFLLIPFYSVIGRRLIEWKVIEKIPSDTIFVKPRWLLVICAGAVIYSALTTNYMLDKLNAQNKFHTLFVGMIILRFSVYFGLALSSLAWYYTQVKKNPE
jgi:hypothetical protein